MTLCFNSVKVPTIPIVGSEQQFPVRRIYCVGRNYQAHAIEMGHSARELPFFFSKPADSILVNPTMLDFPSMTEQLHHEVELVLAIGKSGFELTPERSMPLIYGYALGIDLTKRDLQAEAKAKGRPWDLAKGFDKSAPISSIIVKDPNTALEQGAISLSVNKQVKQQADIADMIWSSSEIIAHLSQHIQLEAGDLIFTGTPSGVGPLSRQDMIEANYNNEVNLKFTIKA